MRLAPLILIIATLVGCTGTGDVFVGGGGTATPPPPARPAAVATDRVDVWSDALRAVSAQLCRALTTGEDWRPYINELRSIVAEMRKFSAGAGTLSSDATGASLNAGVGSNTWGQPNTAPTPEDPDVAAVRIRGEAELEALDGPAE